MKNNKKGFTLVEILIAMSIISLIAMAFYTVLNTSIKSNTKNEKDIKLLNLATSEIENLREQIKDTKEDDLILSNGNDIQWNSTSTEEKNIEYKTKVDNIDCTVQINISRSPVSNSMYLYTIKSIKSKMDNEYFSKREVTLSTQIFGR